MLLFIGRSSTFGFWRQESFVRQLNETLVFLHNQAVSDQAFYRMEFAFGKGKAGSSYRVGVLKAEPEADDRFKTLAQDAGNLTLELAAFLSPSSAGGQSMIPPPLFPSMVEPVTLPEGMKLTDVRTMRGLKTEGKPYILFSPRGFSEFSVIHLELQNGTPLTILVNPFTGLTEIYREYKDFEWTYGHQKDQKKS
jgi:hypothetical protein